MHKIHANITYVTERFDHPDSGSAGVKLLATTRGITACVAKVTFWDGAGQFFIEMNGPEVPLDIVESLITEAKQSIPLS